MRSVGLAVEHVDRRREAETTTVLFAGEALPHFNEVDEGGPGFTARDVSPVAEAGLAPENTLHDLRLDGIIRGNGLMITWLCVPLEFRAAPPAHLSAFLPGDEAAASAGDVFRLGVGTG